MVNFENDIIRGKEGEPVALKSKLGYILSGPMQYESCNHSSTLTCHVLKCQTEFRSPEEDLAEKLNTFWELESSEQELHMTIFINNFALIYIPIKPNVDMK